MVEYPGEFYYSTCRTLRFFIIQKHGGGGRGILWKREVWRKEESVLKQKGCGRDPQALFTVGEHMQQRWTRSLRLSELQVSTCPSPGCSATPILRAPPNPFKQISFLADASWRQVSVTGRDERPDSQYESQPGGYGFKEAGLAFQLFYTWSNQHLLTASHVLGMVSDARKYKDKKRHGLWSQKM